MNIIRGYLGTYASAESRGIYTFTLDKDTGQLSVPELLCEAPDSKYLSLRGGLLAAPVKRGAGAGLLLYRLHSDGTAVREPHSDGTAVREPHSDGTAVREPHSDETGVREPQVVLTEQVPSCYVTQDDEYVYTANYHEGTVRVYKKNGKIPELVHTIENGLGAGCHQILFHGPYLLVTCLLQDRIRFFARENGFAPAGELKFPKGTGPRHGIFDREHRRFFLVSELSNQIFSYEAEGNEFNLRGSQTILKDREVEVTAPASAAIRLSPDQRYLYVSTRFADVLTVFRVDGTDLTMVQQTGSQGAGPRDFVLTEDGRYLLAANRFEGGLVCFRLNPEDGTIEEPCSRVPAVEAVSIVLEEQAK